MTPQALQFVINYINSVIKDSSFYNFLNQNNWNNQGIQYLAGFSHDSQTLSQAISNMYVSFKQSLTQQAQPLQQLPVMQNVQQSYNNQGYNNQGFNQQPYNNQVFNNQGFNQQNLGFNNVNNGTFNRHIDNTKNTQQVETVNTSTVSQDFTASTQSNVTTQSNVVNNVIKPISNMVDATYKYQLVPNKSYVFDRDETALIAENITTAYTSVLENSHSHNTIYVKPITILKTRKSFGDKNVIKRLIEIDNKTIDNFFIELTPVIEKHKEVFSNLTKIVVEWVNDNFYYVTGDPNLNAKIDCFNDILALRDFIGVIPRENAFKDKIIFNKRLTTLLENIRSLYFNFDNGSSEVESGHQMLVDYEKDVLVTRVSSKLYYIDNDDQDMIAAIVNDVYRNNEMYCMLATQDDVSEITINKDREGMLQSYKIRQVYRI